ncbi:MAG TPA: sulfur carrier protein ThiS [Thermoanaerobaculia bacterium]|nr:sulfur carrier protein ThiS [Thermoanaerobaculia bacterium]
MQTTDMEILVNGGTQRLEPGASVAGLITALGLDVHRVAVEINRQLVRRVSFEDRKIEPGDQIEIVEFVGGG